MPIHSQTSATVRPDLGSLAWEYSLDAGSRKFIAPIVFPFFPTSKQSGAYPYIPSASLLRLVETQRAARSGYSRIDWAFSEKPFATKRHGLEAPVDDSERDLYESQYAGLDVDQVNTMVVTDHMLRGYEKRVADMVTNTANLTNAAAAAKWDNKDTATPRADVQTAIETVEGTTGLTPNTAIMSKKLFRRAVQCKDFVDHVKYTRAVLTDNFEAKLSLFADYLEVDRILLGSEKYNAAKKPGDFTPTSIWPDAKVVVATLSDQPMNLKDPTLGRTFLWDIYGKQMLRVETYREESVESDIYRVKADMSEEFVFKGCGYIIHTAM